MLERRDRLKQKQRNERMNMTSPAIIVNEQDHQRRDNRMLYDEEGLGLHTVNDDGEEEHNDDQIREQPP